MGRQRDYELSADWLQNGYSLEVEKLSRTLRNVRCKSFVNFKAPTMFYQSVGAHFMLERHRLGHLRFDAAKTSKQYKASMVRCCTPMYAFELEQNLPEGPFVIKEFVNQPSRMKYADFSESMINDIYLFLLCLYSFDPIRRGGNRLCFFQ